MMDGEDDEEPKEEEEEEEEEVLSAAPATTVWVSGVPLELASEPELRTFFGCCGEVVAVTVERRVGASLLSQTATRGARLCLLAGAGAPNWSLGPRTQGSTPGRWSASARPAPPGTRWTAASTA